MKQQTVPRPVQLTLSLDSKTTRVPVAPGSKELLQALADLLLEALGGQVVQARGRESGDEPENHA